MTYRDTGNRSRGGCGHVASGVGTHRQTGAEVDVNRGWAWGLFATVLYMNLHVVPVCLRALDFCCEHLRRLQSLHCKALEWKSSCACDQLMLGQKNEEGSVIAVSTSVCVSVGLVWFLGADNKEEEEKKFSSVDEERWKNKRRGGGGGGGGMTGRCKRRPEALVEVLHVYRGRAVVPRLYPCSL